MPKSKDIVLAPIHPNAGVEANYQKRLLRLVNEMARSYRYFVTAAYRKDTPVLAEDADPADELKRAMEKLADRWRRRFDDAADDLASYFAKSSGERTDASLKAALKRAGFTIEFRPSPAQRDVMRATVQANVSLIKSIPQQYLTQVEGSVFRAVQTGGDLGTLTKELQKHAGVTRKRAAFIARDQGNKACAAMKRARQTELGIDEEEWRHSGGGKHPRPSHVKAGKDRVRYKVSEGWLDPATGRRIWPGTEVNCFPADTIIGLEATPITLWRSFFEGPMVHVHVGAYLLKGTFNHPVLTARGWVSMGELENGDQVVCMAHQRGDMIADHKNDRVATLGQLFEAGASEFGYVRRDRVVFNFHGDTPDGDVDEVIVVHDGLASNRQSGALKNVGDLVFGETYARMNPRCRSGGGNVSNTNPPCDADNRLLGLGGGVGKTGKIGLAGVSHQAAPDQDISDVRRGVSRSPQLGGNGSRAHAALIQFDNGISERIPVSPAIGMYSGGPELFAEFVRIASNSNSGIFQFGTAAYQLCGVLDKEVRSFSGHVFTMETVNGYYGVSGAFVQAKNCRCVGRPVIKGLEGWA